MERIITELTQGKNTFLNSTQQQIRYQIACLIANGYNVLALKDKSDKDGDKYGIIIVAVEHYYLFDQQVRPYLLDNTCVYDIGVYDNGFGKIILEIFDENYQFLHTPDYHVHRLITISENGYMLADNKSFIW